ncbi:hypothetical protein MKX01_018915 [Papaver californicum]|nr:hypothetical protein MKX01_018915 [Papaver californicum]
MNHQVWVSETVMKLMVLLSVFVYASSATPSYPHSYLVGGESGWSRDTDWKTWSSSNTFSVGDTIVFVYKPVHNVLEVNESAYLYFTTVTHDNLGTRYFTCGTEGHCSFGLKVKIVVNSTRRTLPTVRSPPSPLQSPSPPSNTPGWDVLPGPHAPVPNDHSLVN